MDMEAKTVEQRIERSLSPDLDRILRSSFFVTLTAGSYTRSQLRYFSEQYYVASSAFPQLLALAAANIGDDGQRLALIANLWDEHGKGTALRSHRSILEKFVLATGSMGVASGALRASVATYSYIAGMRALCSDRNEKVILGALGPGCEAFTPAEYVLMLNALKNSYGFSEDQLEFFVDHARHDRKHIEELYDGIELLVGDSDDALREVTFGARVAMQFERVFWEVLDQEMRLVAE